MMHDVDGEAVRVEPKKRRPTARVAFAAFVLLVAGGGAAYLALSRQGTELARAQGALELQVLTSRLGAAAIHAEYGQFDEARSIVAGVFDGIVTYGIEQGSLPENYATVLRMRDEVVVALARERPEVKERLVELFFMLQLPVDTELDPAYIIPATDSGVGIAPPRRLAPAPEPLTPDTAAPEAVTDTMAPIPPDTVFGEGLTGRRR